MKNFLLFSLQIKNIVLLLHRQNKAIGLWCNGNTTDSGPVILGSNPGSPTKTIFFGGSFFCFCSGSVCKRVVVPTNGVAVHLSLMQASDNAHPRHSFAAPLALISPLGRFV